MALFIFSPINEYGDPSSEDNSRVGGRLLPWTYPASYSTDRLMQRMDRRLFSTQYFHGTNAAAELIIRGCALIQNYAPSNPRTSDMHNGFQSPVESLNKLQYNEN